MSGECGCADAWMRRCDSGESAAAGAESQRAREGEGEPSACEIE